MQAWVITSAIAALILSDTTVARASQAQASFAISVNVQPSCIVRTSHGAADQSVVTVVCSPAEVSRVRLSYPLQGQLSLHRLSRRLPAVPEPGTMRSTASGTLVQIDF